MKKWLPIQFNRNHIIGLVVLVFLLIGIGVYFGRGSSTHPPHESSSQQKEIYSCPMHPSIVSDRPGKCPICHMDLQKVERDAATHLNHASEKTDKKVIFYRHPMKPEITSQVPAKDEMGMDYVPVYEEETSSDGKSSVEGRAAFTLSQERQQLIGVTTGKVRLQPLSVEIRASGKAAFDPDLFTAIEEYRQAIQSASQMKESPYESLRTQAQELAASAKTKLRLLGLADSQIRKLGSANVSPMNLLLPKGNIWIYAEIFEYELPQVKDGQSVEVTSPSLPGKTFEGKVTSISPVVNPQTRTARVRALVPDPKGHLRPDSFVNVRIKADLGEKLVIPSEAVLHSGEESFVFVVQGEGRFEPKKVVLGTKATDLYEVVSGLSANDTVVTSANFLIDSESRLRGVIKNMQQPVGSPAPVTPGHGGHGGSGP